MKPASRHSARPAPFLMIAVSCAILGLLLVAWLFLSQPNSPNRSHSPPETNAPPAELMSLYGALLGRWVRTDGSYMLDVRAIDGDGKAQVQYFNPRPIHVARAEASRDGDQLKMTVVLEDVGYPGSYYTLHLTPQSRQLRGEYYQASMQETFDVSFNHLP